MEHPLRTYRRNAKLSLDKLAAEIGESKPKLSRVETGQQDADMELVRKVIQFTGGEVTAADFARFVPKPKRSAAA